MPLDLDREQWHRQLLQRDRELTVEEAVDGAAGIYSTAPTSYLSLVARVPGFTKADLDRALYDDRTLVRMSALRGSAFLVPIDMIDTVVSATDRKDVFADWAGRIVGDAQPERWRSDIMQLLDGRILPARAIRKEIGVTGKDAEALRYVLSSMTFRRELASASGPKSWRDNQYGYALWSQWLPDHPPQVADPSRARQALATWYLRGHGPASVGDFAWYAGLKKSSASSAFADSEVVDVGDGLFDVGPRAGDVEPHGLRLLPVWDTALVRQKQWRRMVPEEHFRFVYDASGNVTSTIIRDGSVVGVWDRSGNNTRLEITAAFFDTPDQADRAAVFQESAVIATALGVGDHRVEFTSKFVDLHTAGRNRFLSPLSGS